MDFPLLLLVLLALPIVTAAVILAVSAARRRSRNPSDQPAHEGVHRFQTDTAAVQDATVHPPAAGREAIPGRERRAASASEPAPRADQGRPHHPAGRLRRHVTEPDPAG